MKKEKTYAFCDVNIRVLYLVHGKVMGYDVPHFDKENTDPARSRDRFDFAPDCFNDDGSWKYLNNWIDDREQHECSMFPVDGRNGFINVNEISAIWHSVNGVEHGRPAWLPAASDTTD